MFLLGHSVWGYLFCRLAGKKFRADIPISLVLLAGIIPDLDFFFQPFGLVHHTFTHSLVIVGPLLLLLILLFKQRGFVISLGILSHLFVDAIVGTIPLLFPLSVVDVGLGLPLAVDAILESGGLLLALLFMLRNGDAQSIFRGDSRNILIMIPFVAIVSLSLMFALDNNIYLPTYAFARKALIVITLGHYLLGFIMSLAIFLGFKTWFGDMLRSRKEQG